MKKCSRQDGTVCPNPQILCIECPSFKEEDEKICTLQGLLCPYPRIKCDTCPHFRKIDPLPRIAPYHYVCFVEGGSTPKYRHATLRKAEIEADRLSCLPENIGKKVFVMAILNTRYTTKNTYVTEE